MIDEELTVDPLANYAQTRATQRITQGAYAQHLEETSETPINAEYIIANDIADPNRELSVTPEWVEASKQVHSLFAPNEELGSDQEYGEWGIEFMGEFNWNMQRMGTTAQTVYYGKATDEQKRSMLMLMDGYDTLPVTWQGTKRAFKGVLNDPTTYIGLTTLGWGLLGRAGVKGATKQGFRKMIVDSLKSPVKIGAAEGALYAGAEDTFRQQVEVAAGAREEVSQLQTAATAGAGAVVGGTAAKVLDVVPRAAYKYFKGRRETKQMDDFKRVIDSDATIDEIERHPALATATKKMESIPRTDQAEGYQTPEWISQRQFNFGEDGSEKVTGYVNAASRLYNDALTLAHRDQKLEVPSDPVAFEGNAYIVVGPPASGKSFIANKIAVDKKLAIIDPDEAKKVFPEYDGGIGANAVHLESKALTSAVEELALDKNANVLYPTVGHDVGKVTRDIKRLKSRGYNVFLVDVSLPLEETKRRAYRRFAEKGRLVPTSYINEVGEKPSQTYLTLKEAGIADGYAKIDNSAPPDQPRVIIEDSGNVLPQSFE